MKDRSALIVGVSGQDGILLAQHLLGQGYAVFGTSRRLDGAPTARLAAAGILDRIHLATLDPCSFSSVADMVRGTKPAEIYNLAGQSSVASSFQYPSETVESVTRGTLALLEAVRTAAPEARLFNAGSSECFGNTEAPASERTSLAPRSPYGAAKAASMHLVCVYRSSYGLFACSGITFNHESPIRPPQFVTSKVANFVARLGRGARDKLKVGNLSIRRDWGWAPEYVEAFHLMLQADEPHDLVLATGQSNTLAEFIAACFETVGLRSQDHIEVDPGLFRPSEIQVSAADPSSAMKTIGWRAKSMMRDVAAQLVRSQLAAASLSATA
jgi:GDPmannose 4,6-dehydratase